MAAQSPDDATPAALHQLSLQHMQAGRHLDAQLCCKQALAKDPQHVDSLQLMGMLCLQARQIDHAIAWITRANAQDPKADFLASLAIALAQQNLHAEALKAFSAAVRIRPDDSELWLQQGDVLAAVGRPADAVTSYQQALKLNPQHATSAYRCGVLLRGLNRHEEALTCLDLCDRLVPNNATVLEQRGLALHDLKRFEAALAVSLQLYALNPAPEICNNIGAALQRLQRDEEAVSWFDKALAQLPGSVPVLINKAGALGKLLRLDEAFATYAQAKAIEPGNASVELLLSELQLLTGDFEAGWAGHEARRRSRFSSAYPQFTQPEWLGDDPVDGRTILIYADEGLGDTIQFARYIPMLAARGARVILLVDAPLIPLLTGLKGVAQLLTKSTSVVLPAFDLHCPICSLPYAFRASFETIPPDDYLPQPTEARVQAWEDRLQARLGPRRKLRVGLTWSGRPGHGNDHNRSLQLQKLTPLLELDVAFVSLQKEPRPDDKAVLGQTKIVDLTADLTDLAETAALMSCLDLVIAVDTSVAHLAAALGRPTWILLPYAPDFRWLLGRDDSPWYSSVRLFRQDERRDYASVIAQLRAALEARL